MALNKPLEQITAADLESLKTNRVPESRTLDYKRELPGTSDEAKREFRGDVTALANTDGGHLIFGISESDGVPEDLIGFPSTDNRDEIKRRLEQILENNIEPRLLGVTMQEVWLSDVVWLLVVRVPPSWAKPHAVVHNQYRKFWLRGSTKNDVMDVPQLRAAFTLSANVEERIREFRSQRISEINIGPGWIRAAFHLIPASAFTSQTHVDLAAAHEGGGLYHHLNSWGTRSRFTLDGLLCGYSFPEEMDNRGDYALIFRNGIIEAVDTKRVAGNDQGGSTIDFDWIGYDHSLVRDLGQLLSVQKLLGITPPVFIMLTFVGVKGSKIKPYPGRYAALHPPLPIDRDIVPLTPVMIEDLDASPQVILKDALDEFWQAAGWPRSRSYDEQGKWMGSE